MLDSRKKQILIFLAVGPVLVGGAFLYGWKGSARPGSSIPPIGGCSQGRFHLPDAPIFLQNDPRWSEDEIGGSRESLGTVGCAITSVSMALAHHGIEMLPKQLNDRLKSTDGYTGQGWVKWNKIAELTDRKVRIEIPEMLTHDSIDGALQTGRPVIVKILLRQAISHWVLIVGKSDREYLIKDPLGDGKSLEKLSKFDSDIYAVRIVAR